MSIIKQFSKVLFIMFFLSIGINGAHADNRLSKKGDMYSGSGFFINSEGYIVTAGHMVKEGGDFLVEYNGTEYEATLVAADYVHDVAILHINVSGNTYLNINTSVTFSTRLQQIDIYGYPNPMVFGNNLKISHGQELNLGVDDKFIPLNSFGCGGNSGGPVTDSLGDVLGVLVAGSTDPIHKRPNDCSTLEFMTSIKYVEDLAKANKLTITDTEGTRTSGYTPNASNVMMILEVLK